MSTNIKITLEEKVLINILFKNNTNKKDLLNIDFERFVKIASGHLMLPALYYNLCKKGLLKIIPPDLSKYLKEIYDLNMERNLILEKELVDIEKILNDNQIKFRFIKGAEFIKFKYFENIGVRMIGDIDILIKEKDKKKVIRALVENNFKSNMEYKLWKRNHLPRFISDEKYFAIEIHTSVLRPSKKKLLKTHIFFDENQKEKILNNLKTCILNYQINDYGHLYKNYSYRTIYDFMNIENEKLKLKDFKEKYFESFFTITNGLNITNYKVNFNFKKKLYVIVVSLNKNNKLFYFTHKIICDIIKYTPIRLNQILELLINPKYRKYFYEKYIK